MSKPRAWQGPEVLCLLGCYDHCVENKLKPHTNVPNLLSRFGYDRRWYSCSGKLRHVVSHYNGRSERFSSALCSRAFATLECLPKDMQDQLRDIRDKINPEVESQPSSQGSIDLVGDDGDVAVTDVSETVSIIAEVVSY
jgi:hypothetical protein